jgi:magnesium-transporting ATPase (P-type)
VHIYKFEGVIKINDTTISLDHENLLLRGMSLKNTDFIYGLVIFTGHETKVMKNSEEATYKSSRLELLTNKTIKLVLLV